MNEQDFEASVLQAMRGQSNKQMMRLAVKKMLEELASQLEREPTEEEFFDYLDQLTKFYYKEVEPLGIRPIKYLPQPPVYKKDIEGRLS